MLLDQKTAVTFEEEKERADTIMDRLMQDEEVKNLLARKILQIYGSSLPKPTA